MQRADVGVALGLVAEPTGQFDGGQVDGKVALARGRAGVRRRKRDAPPLRAGEELGVEPSGGVQRTRGGIAAVLGRRHAVEADGTGVDAEPATDRGQEPVGLVDDVLGPHAHEAIGSDPLPELVDPPMLLEPDAQAELGRVLGGHIPIAQRAPGVDHRRDRRPGVADEVEVAGVGVRRRHPAQCAVAEGRLGRLLHPSPWRDQGEQVVEERGDAPVATLVEPSLCAHDRGRGLLTVVQLREGPNQTGASFAGRHPSPLGRLDQQLADPRGRGRGAVQGSRRGSDAGRAWPRPTSCTIAPGPGRSAGCTGPGLGASRRSGPRWSRPPDYPSERSLVGRVLPDHARLRQGARSP